MLSFNIHTTFIPVKSTLHMSSFLCYKYSKRSLFINYIDNSLYEGHRILHKHLDVSLVNSIIKNFMQRITATGYNMNNHTKKTFLVDHGLYVAHNQIKRYMLPYNTCVK